MDSIILILFVAMFGIPIFGIYIKKNRFKHSSYKDSSGNSFSKTVNSKGSIGEFLIYEELETLPGINHIYANVYIPKSNNAFSEIDVVMLNPTGIYVFESKNYSGWIFGNDKNKMWTQTFKASKHQFPNPVFQNRNHIKSLEMMIKEYTGLENMPIFSYVVFGTRATIKDVTVNDQCVKVITRSHLRNNVQSDIHARSKQLSDTQISTISNLLHCFSNADEKTKEVHIQNIRNYVSNKAN